MQIYPWENQSAVQKKAVISTSSAKVHCTQSAAFHLNRLSNIDEYVEWIAQIAVFSSSQLLHVELMIIIYDWLDILALILIKKNLRLVNIFPAFIFQIGICFRLIQRNPDILCIVIYAKLTKWHLLNCKEKMFTSSKCQIKQNLNLLSVFSVSTFQPFPQEQKKVEVGKLQPCLARVTNSMWL